MKDSNSYKENNRKIIYIAIIHQLHLSKIIAWLSIIKSFKIKGASLGRPSYLSIKTLKKNINLRSQEMPLFSPIGELSHDNNQVIFMVYKAYQNIHHVII